MSLVTEFAGSAGAQFMVDVSLKAAVILAAAWGICLILSWRRSSAAARHMVWTLAMASVLALPLLAAALPSWTVEVSWQREAAPLPLIIEPDLSAGPLAVMHVAAAPSESHEATRDDNTVPLAEASSLTEPSSYNTLRALDATWLLWAWLIGALVTLAPACLGLASLWFLRRSSQPVTCGAILAAWEAIIAGLGVKPRVRLLETAARSMPMTWGAWPATILLPAEAERWPADRLRAVLLHELAHVQRRDCLTQLLAQLARAVYWFNPLAWLGERRLRVEQEQACDDFVLSRGFKASSYAQHLLEVLAGVRSPRCAAAPGLAMARASTIERRLLSILNPRQDRRQLSRRRMGLMAAACFAIVSSLTALHLESADGREPAGQAAGDPQAAAAKTLADLRARIAEQYVTEVDAAEVERGTIRGMLGALRDPYSDYLTPEMLAELDKQLGGQRVGIGVHLDLHEQQVRVVTPLADSPALAAGIRPGDLILEIDGKSAAGIDLAEAVKRIAGPQGTVVKLSIGRGGEQLERSVTRGPIKVQSVKGFRRGAENRWEFLLDAKDKIGYVQIAQLGSATVGDTRAAVESLTRQGLRGLILDLRFCPGGSLEAAVGVAKLFLSRGTIVSLHSRGNEPMTITADASATLGDFPLVVLVNGQTASAAEVVAGALQDNQRALVLGTRTHGKGSVQTIIKLDEGSGAIKLTTSQYRVPSGRSIDRRPQAATWGIDPNDGYFLPLDREQVNLLLQRRQEREIIGRKPEEVAGQNAPITAKWIEAEQADPQLAAALTTLSQRLATGEFVKVSQLGAEKIEQFLKREEVHDRREAVLRNLQQLNQELAELEKAAPANK